MKRLFLFFLCILFLCVPFTACSTVQEAVGVGSSIVEKCGTVPMFTETTCDQKAVDQDAADKCTINKNIEQSAYLVKLQDYAACIEAVFNGKEVSGNKVIAILSVNISTGVPEPPLLCVVTPSPKTQTSNIYNI